MTLSPDLVLSLVRKYHTPLYVFDEATIRRQCRELKAAIPYQNKVIRYACKALTLQAVLKIIREEGLWIDASSVNEVHRALRAGFENFQILYTGESASSSVFSELCRLGVTINCSSLDQLRLVGKVRPGSDVSVRFNPGEGHGCSNKVNTGGPASKHGIYHDQAAAVREMLEQYKLRLVGVHSHIGSESDLAHWLRIKDLTLDIARQFPDVRFVDLGGGLPIVYNPDCDRPMPLREWGVELSKSFEAFSLQCGRDIQLQIEPGRYIVAESGYLLAEVQNIKQTPQYSFVVVNTGFNHNPRPMTYGSFHPIEFVMHDGREVSLMKDYVVAGYLCESGDVFTVKEGGVPAPRRFPELALGDIMVMSHIGAYSHAMKSEYNSMNLPASVLIEESGSIRVIERRGTLEDLMRREMEAY